MRRSRCPTPATRFARCHRLTRPWRCDSQGTRKTTRLKCCAHAKWLWRSPKFSKCCGCHDKRNFWKRCYIWRLSHETCGLIQTRVKSGSAAPATQNDITACFGTFENDRLRSFSHRHGDAIWKPENRDEPCWSLKTSIYCETSSKFNFVATKSTLSCEFSHEHLVLPKNRCFAQSFCQFSSHPTKSDKTPCLPGNLHVVTICRIPDNAMRKKHATRHVWSAAPTQNDHGGHHGAAAATENATYLPKTTQKYGACHKKRLSTRYETCWNVTSAAPARRNEATKLLKPPRMTTFAELARGTAIRSSRGRLRTVADGNVERTHPQPPDHGSLATQSRKEKHHGNWEKQAKTEGKKTREIKKKECKGQSELYLTSGLNLGCSKLRLSSHHCFPSTGRPGRITPAEPVSLRTIFWQVAQSWTFSCSKPGRSGGFSMVFHQDERWKLGETPKNWWDLKVFCQEFSNSNPTKRWSNITEFSGKPTHLCRDGRRWHDRWRGRQTQGAPSPSYPDVSEIPPILCNFWPQHCSLAATQKIFPLS